jgi:hypothetical protein
MYLVISDGDTHIRAMVPRGAAKEFAKQSINTKHHSFKDDIMFGVLNIQKAKLIIKCEVSDQDKLQAVIEKFNWHGRILGGKSIASTVSISEREKIMQKMTQLEIARCGTGAEQPSPLRSQVSSAESNIHQLASQVSDLQNHLAHTPTSLNKSTGAPREQKPKNLTESAVPMRSFDQTRGQLIGLLSAGKRSHSLQQAQPPEQVQPKQDKSLELQQNPAVENSKLCKTKAIEDSGSSQTPKTPDIGVSQLLLRDGEAQSSQNVSESLKSQKKALSATEAGYVATARSDTEATSDYVKEDAQIKLDAQITQVHVSRKRSPVDIEPDVDSLPSWVVSFKSNINFRKLKRVAYAINAVARHDSE